MLHVSVCVEGLSETRKPQMLGQSLEEGGCPLKK